MKKDNQILKNKNPKDGDSRPFERVVRQPEHDWRKTNLLTLDDKKGFYDTYKCEKCGKKFKRYGFSWEPPESKCKVA